MICHKIGPLLNSWKEKEKLSKRGSVRMFRYHRDVSLNRNDRKKLLKVRGHFGGLRIGLYFPTRIRQICEHPLVTTII